MRKLALLAASALALAAAPASAAELVTNGGFETGNFSGWSHTGNLSFTGVTSSNGPAAGSFHAILGPVGSVGVLSQTLATVAGSTYTFAFDVKVDAGTPNSFNFTVGNSTVSFANIALGAYTHFTGTFVAGPGSTPLTISFQHDPSYIYLDNVSVLGLAAVPEPTSWALMIVGFGAIGSSMRLRRRAARTVAA